MASGSGEDKEHKMYVDAYLGVAERSKVRQLRGQSTCVKCKIPYELEVKFGVLCCEDCAMDFEEFLDAGFCEDVERVINAREKILKNWEGKLQEREDTLRKRIQAVKDKIEGQLQILTEDRKRYEKDLEILKGSKEHRFSLCVENPQVAGKEEKVNGTMKEEGLRVQEETEEGTVVEEVKVTGEWTGTEELEETGIEKVEETGERTGIEEVQETGDWIQDQEGMKEEIEDTDEEGQGQVNDEGQGQMDDEGQGQREEQAQNEEDSDQPSKKRRMDRSCRSSFGNCPAAAAQFEEKAKPTGHWRCFFDCKQKRGSKRHGLRKWVANIKRSYPHVFEDFDENLINANSVICSRHFKCELGFYGPAQNMTDEVFKKNFDPPPQRK